MGTFDYARIEDGRIVEGIQQSDTLSQMRQMYAGTARKAAVIGGVLGLWPWRVCSAAKLAPDRQAARVVLLSRISHT